MLTNSVIFACEIRISCERRARSRHALSACRALLERMRPRAASVRNADFVEAAARPDALRLRRRPKFGNLRWRGAGRRDLQRLSHVAQAASNLL
eukprot:4663423-Pleurochrysis_carterae.AAC.6